ncbi:MAG: FapA family protein [Kiritimatiellae bacterium]|nr:FapA family protein [Verrucomicrobiota bacterium]MBU4365746.1 FapA family protein [Verrucomicrobiota bacterium]MCG2659145.1 FapA family protein [Kiritimatiellia bacterium]
MRAIHHNIGKPRAPHNDRAGSALVAVLGVSLILMLAGVTMVVLSRQSMHRIHRTVRYAQAQAVAEAGIADMIAKLGTNYTAWQNTTYMNTFFTNGAYYVTTRQTNGNVLITSDGIYMEASNRTIIELLGTVSSNWDELYNLNSAVMAGGNVNFSTAAFTMNGDIHANGNATSSGGAQNGTVNGNISAVGNIGTFNNVTGTNNDEAAVETIPPTGPFNFDSYRQMATNNGTYLESNQTLVGKPITNSANGILYVNGNLTIQNQSSFTGTIVVAGNVTIVNHFTQTNDPSIYDPVSSNMPSLLCTGNITINNNTTLNGVVYAAGNVIIQNNTTINGGVISGGNTEIQNSTTITAGAGYPVWDPLDPTVPPEVIVGGWLK